MKVSWDFSNVKKINNTVPSELTTIIPVTPLWAWILFKVSSTSDCKIYIKDMKNKNCQAGLTQIIIFAKVLLNLKLNGFLSSLILDYCCS